MNAQGQIVLTAYPTPKVFHTRIRFYECDRL
jgi:hypothetical protein